MENNRVIISECDVKYRQTESTERQPLRSLHTSSRLVYIDTSDNTRTPKLNEVIYSDKVKNPSFVNVEMGKDVPKNVCPSPIPIVVTVKKLL